MIRKALVVIVWKKSPTALPQDRRVLALKLVDARGGSWSSVTGKVEEGENFFEGALREAEEETGFRFERQPQYLGLEHSFPGRWGEAHEKCFALFLIGGNAPPEPKLDPNEHVAFQWLTPEAAIQTVKFDMDKKSIERAALGLAPAYLSKRGEFFQDGEEITHERTKELLHRSLSKDGNGFKIKLGLEELEVVVEDTARFVVSFDSSGEMKLLHGEAEKLDPSTLVVRSDNSFVCTLKSGWEAIFLPAAYYEIAKFITPCSVPGEYLLHLGGRDHLLRVTHEGEGKSR